MTATIKEFCRFYGIDEASADLADIIYNALIGGDADGHLEGHCAGGGRSPSFNSRRRCGKS